MESIFSPSVCVGGFELDDSVDLTTIKAELLSKLKTS